MRFLNDLDTMQESVPSPFTVIIQDTLGNSYIAGDEGDPQITVEEYERTEKDNIELGIYDMVV